MATRALAFLVPAGACSVRAGQIAGLYKLESCIAVGTVSEVSAAAACFPVPYFL